MSAPWSDAEPTDQDLISPMGPLYSSASFPSYQEQIPTRSETDRAVVRGHRRFPVIAGTASAVLLLAGGTYLALITSRPLDGVDARGPTVRAHDGSSPAPRDATPGARDARVLPAARNADLATAGQGSPTTATPEASVSRDTRTDPPVSPVTTVPSSTAASLSVTAPGAAELLLDGQRLGRAPLSQHPIAPGPHRLQARSSSMHFSVTRAIRAQPGEHLEIGIAPGKGTLRVLVRPWATVTLDGKPMGTTPLPPITTYEGPHVLVLSNDSLQAKKTVRVVVLANVEKVVKVKLP